MNTTKMMMKMVTVAVAGLVLAPAARAAETPAAAAAKADIQKTFGFVPQFLGKLRMLAAGAWEEMKTLQLNRAGCRAGPKADRLGVAAQIRALLHHRLHRLREAGPRSGGRGGQAVAMAASRGTGART